MNEAQFNARAAADPMWFTRFARGFMALCLKHYEDVLRAQHAALLARSRADPDSHYVAYENPQFYDGRDFFGTDPLFWDGGPPRHFGAVGDISERQRLFDGLQGTQRSAYFRSSAYAKLRSLHRRMWVYFSDFEGRSPWQVISEIYRMYHMYASGANERAEMLGMGIAGAAIGAAGTASNLAGLGSRSVPMVRPAGGGGRTPGPGRDTVEDLQYSSTLPGPARETTPPPAAYEQLVQATATELGGASGRGGR